MPSLLGNNQVQQHAAEFIDLPEEAVKRMPDAINKKNNVDSAPSLLSTVGWGAGATGAFQAKSMWQGRELAKKKTLFNPKSLSRLSSAGKFARNLGAGAAAGALVTAPADYLSGKMSEKYENDDKFHAGHFAAIAAPSAVAATAGTGSFLNTVEQMKAAPKIGTKQMVKNIVSPTKIMSSAKKEFRGIGSTFRTGKIGSGLLAATLIGASAIDPLMYLNKTLKKKKKDNMEKTASFKESVKKSVKKNQIKNKIAGAAILSAATYYGLKSAKDTATRNYREWKQPSSILNQDSRFRTN